MVQTKKEIKEYKRQYFQKNKERLYKLKRVWRENNREKDRSYQRKYNKSHKEIHRKNNYNYAKRHPERIFARSLANRKLKDLKREGCEFHHKDYSKPLDVEVMPIEEHRKLLRRLK